MHNFQIDRCCISLQLLADPRERGQSDHSPYHGLGGLAPPSQAAAKSVKGRWTMEISLFV